MIDKNKDYVAWVIALAYELDDAQEHLQELRQALTDDPEFDEEEFRSCLAHVYSHLNRAWNGRNATEAQTKDRDLWRQWSGFPTDLEPL